MKNIEEIFELAHNKSYDDIYDMYRVLMESCRQWLSRYLMDYDESNPLGCNIVVEPMGTYGLSDLEKPNLVSLYQQAGDGIIWLLFEGEKDYVELDFLDLETIVFIVGELEHERR